MKILLKLLFIAGCSHLVGTFLLSATMEWPDTGAILGGVPFLPLLALAGWPVLIFELGGVLLLWGAWSQGLVRQRALTGVAGLLMGMAVTTVPILVSDTPPEPGSERWRYAVAFGAGSCGAGLVAGLLVPVLFKRRERATSP